MKQLIKGPPCPLAVKMSKLFFRSKNKSSILVVLHGDIGILQFSLVIFCNTWEMSA